MAEEFVKKAIEAPVVVFSKTYCQYCTYVKKMFREAGVKDLYVIELDKRGDCSEVQDILLRMTGARTVPRVFIGGKSIGGTADVEALVNSGQLEATLKEAGAITEAITDYTTYFTFASLTVVGMIGIVLAYSLMRKK